MAFTRPMRIAASPPRIVNATVTTQPTPARVERDVRLGKADLRIEDEGHAAEEGLADLEEEDEAQHRGGDGKALLPEEARERADHGAAEPGGGAAEGAGKGEAGGDPALVLGLGGEPLRRRGLAHEEEADVAEHDHGPEHEEGRLPVVLDAGVLERLGCCQGDDPADLESGPPADDRGRRTGGHGLLLRPADLLDPERVDGDVLGSRRRRR